MRVIATSPVHAARYYAVVRRTHLSEGARPEKKGARLDKKKGAAPIIIKRTTKSAGNSALGIVYTPGGGEIERKLVL